MPAAYILMTLEAGVRRGASKSLYFIAWRTLLELSLKQAGTRRRRRRRRLLHLSLG
jgi:hypothetical protein